MSAGLYCPVVRGDCQRNDCIGVRCRLVEQGAMMDKAMSKTEMYYICSQCGRASGEATITHDYTPTENDLRLRKVVADRRDQHLHCPCGHVYTWFSARQVTLRDRT